MIKLKDILNEVTDITEDDLLKKSSEEIIDSFEYGTQGFNTKEDAIEYLDELKEESFPDGLINIPSEMTLYRVVLIQRGKKIDEKEIGQHFVAYKELVTSDDFLEDIGVLDWIDEESQLWLLTCKVPKSNLDLHETVRNRLMFPQEEEFTLKSPQGIRVVNKEQVDISDYL